MHDGFHFNDYDDGESATLTQRILLLSSALWQRVLAKNTQFEEKIQSAFDFFFRVCYECISILLLIYTFNVR